MTILAVDTTSASGSLAVLVNGEVRAETHIEAPDGFGHVVFTAIEDVLRPAGVAMKDIDCFASASGPGSFTGVRVGLAAVKGLGEATGKPVAAISNLRAVAVGGTAGQRAVLWDARRGQVFAAVYGADLELLSAEVVTMLEPWLASLEPFAGEFIAPESLREKLAGRPFVAAETYLARAIARCAEMDGRRGLWQDPAAIDANYVRQSDAELFWKDR